MLLQCGGGGGGGGGGGVGGRGGGGAGHKAIQIELSSTTVLSTAWILLSFFTHSESIMNRIVTDKADSTAQETASLTYRNAKENPHQSVDILTVLQLYLINRTSLEAARAA